MYVETGRTNTEMTKITMMIITKISNVDNDKAFADYEAIVQREREIVREIHVCPPRKAVR